MFEHLLGAGGEVVVGSHPFDLCGKRVDDELVDAVAAHVCNGFGVVGEVVGNRTVVCFVMTS